MRLDVSIVVALIAGALVGGAGAQPAPALFPITVNDRHGMIDRDGNVVIPPEYAEPVVFRDGLARVARGQQDRLSRRDGQLRDLAPGSGE